LYRELITAEYVTQSRGTKNIYKFVAGKSLGNRPSEYQGVDDINGC